MPRALITLLCAALLAGCSSVRGRLLAPDPRERAQALEDALRYGGARKKELAREMAKELSSSDQDRRAYAAEALEDIGPQAAAAAPQLIKALGDPEISVGDSARRTLTRLSAAAPLMAGALLSVPPVVRKKLEEILSAQGDDGALALAANFGKGNKELAIESIAALAGMREKAAKAVPALVRAAVSDDPDIKTLALAALGDIGAPSGRFLSGLLASGAPSYREGASVVLAAMKPPPASALPALAAALSDPDAAVRLNSAKALDACPPGMLAGLSQDQAGALQKAAAAGGAPAAPAADALLKSGKASPDWLAGQLSSSSTLTRELAAAALASSPHPPLKTAAALLAALKDPSPGVRRAAARALGRFPETAAAGFPKDAAASLSAALGDTDRETRELAATPLGRLAASDKKALYALIAALRGRNAGVRIAAADAIAALGRRGAAAERQLWRAFRTRDCAQRTAAARALAAIKPSLRRLPAVAREMRRACPARPAALSKEGP